MADGGNFEGGMAPQQQIQPVEENTSVPEPVLEPADPVNSSNESDARTSIANLQSEMAPEQETFDTTVPVLPGASDSPTMPFEVQQPKPVQQEQTLDDLRKDLVDAENAKRVEDEEVFRAMQENGPAGATLKKWVQLREKLKISLGKSDEELDQFLKSDAGKAIEEIFYSSEKKNAKINDGNIIADESLQLLRSEAALKAERYRKESLSETLGSAAESVINMVDIETFLLAIIGQDVSKGRYGATESHNRSLEKENSTQEMFNSVLKEYPQYFINLARAGLHACREYHDADLEDPKKIGELSLLLESIKADPQKCRQFVWGMFNVLGRPSEAAKMQYDEASRLMESVIYKVKSKSEPEGMHVQ